MRFFIGIALPEKVRNTLADDAEKLQKAIPGRYAPKSNYHITLVFIGEINQNSIPGIKRAMETAVEGQNRYRDIKALVGAGLRVLCQ
ncbi:MAG: hypothetical protein LUF92_12300 [Clostridiales bacterium]|nr:hypothetical protein [Clostridiales bacterium]